MVLRDVLEDGVEPLFLPRYEINERVAGADQRVEVGNELWRARRGDVQHVHAADCIRGTRQRGAGG